VEDGRHAAHGPLERSELARSRDHLEPAVALGKGEVAPAPVEKLSSTGGSPLSELAPVVMRTAGSGHRARLDNFSTGSRSKPRLCQGQPPARSDRRRSREPQERRAGRARRDGHLPTRPAMRSVPRSIADPSAPMPPNVTAAAPVVAAARQKAEAPHRLRLLVFRVRRAATDLPKREEQPVAPIPRTRRPGGRVASTRPCGAALFGVETWAPYFNVFGPGQDPKTSTPPSSPASSCGACTRKPLQVHGRTDAVGTFHLYRQRRPCDLLAAAAPASAVSGKAYTSGAAGRTSLLEIIASLEGLLGRPSRAPTSPRAWATCRTPRRHRTRPSRDFGYAPSWISRGTSAGRSLLHGGDTMTILARLGAPCSPWPRAAPAERKAPSPSRSPERRGSIDDQPVLGHIAGRRLLTTSRKRW